MLICCRPAKHFNSAQDPSQDKVQVTRKVKLRSGGGIEDTIYNFEDFVMKRFELG